MVTVDDERGAVAAHLDHDRLVPAVGQVLNDLFAPDDLLPGDQIGNTDALHRVLVPGGPLRTRPCGRVERHLHDHAVREERLHGRLRPNAFDGARGDVDVFPNLPHLHPFLDHPAARHPRHVRQLRRLLARGAAARPDVEHFEDAVLVAVANVAGVHVDRVHAVGPQLPQRVGHLVRDRVLLRVCEVPQLAFQLLRGQAQDLARLGVGHERQRLGRGAEPAANVLPDAGDLGAAAALDVERRDALGDEQAHAALGARVPPVDVDPAHEPRPVDVGDVAQLPTEQHVAGSHLALVGRQLHDAAVLHRSGEPKRPRAQHVGLRHAGGAQGLGDLGRPRVGVVLGGMHVLPAGFGSGQEVGGEAFGCGHETSLP